MQICKFCPQPETMTDCNGTPTL